ncbi:hypothetical protein [Neptuniibacter sp.]|uniref:hypothetical protein n=1 Tax=Neptuniibacter sp. TaxID=1962643 RepID=UPI003B5C9951
MSKFPVIPHGTQVNTIIHNAELRKSCNGTFFIRMDFRVDGGDYDKRHIWHSFMLTSHNEFANEISRDMYNTMMAIIGLAKADIKTPEKPVDSKSHTVIPELIGHQITFIVKHCKHENYRDTNEVNYFK